MNGRMIKQEFTSENKRITGTRRGHKIDLTPYIYIYIYRQFNCRKKTPRFYYSLWKFKFG
jgi:hypothetical protein